MTYTISKKIKAWAIIYKSYLLGTYKTKKEATIAIRSDPQGYKIFPCEISFDSCSDQSIGVGGKKERKLKRKK